jgi:transcriptional regulator with XRE-family HTH domain
MPESHGYLQALLKNLETLRKNAGISKEELEKKLILGPGWIRRFETAQSLPSLDMLLAILHEIDADFADLLRSKIRQRRRNGYTTST